MKISIAKITATFGALALGLAPASAEKCESVGAAVKKAVADEPAKVLVIVDEMIGKNEACACEIVKAAIEASDADSALVREIVVTAVTAAQGMAVTIAECAVAQAPEAAGEIKAGLNEVFAGAKHAGGKEVVYEDDYSAKGGKEVVVEEEEEDLGPAPVVISGVYLIAPVAPTSGGFGLVPDGKGGLISLEDLQKEQDRIIEIIRRQAREGRDSDRDGSTRIIASPPDAK